MLMLASTLIRLYEQKICCFLFCFVFILHRRHVVGAQNSSFSTVKMYEQNKKVIITLIVIKTVHICFFDIGL